METKVKDKTLVKITNEVAEEICQHIGTYAIGISSTGQKATYQYHLDNLKKIQAAGGGE